MSQKNKKAAAVTVIFSMLSSLPVYGDTPCVPQAADPIGGNKDNISKTLNFLSDPSDCTGVLTSGEEIAFLKKLDAINADYLTGKISLKEHGQEMISAADKIAGDSEYAQKTGDKKKVANLLKATGVGVDTGYAEAIGKIANDYKAQHNGQLSPEISFLLTRLGKAHPKQYASEVGAVNKEIMGAFKSAGVTQDAKGVWNYLGMSKKYSAADFSKNAALTSAMANYLSPAHSAALATPGRATAVFAANQVFLPPQGKDGKIEVVSTTDYAQRVKDSLSAFQASAKSFLSASTSNANISSYATDIFKGGTAVGAQRNRYKREMQEQYDKIKALGPVAGMNDIDALMNNSKQQDAANLQMRAERIGKLEKGLGIAFAGWGITKAVDLIAGEEVAAGAGTALKLARGARQSSEAAEAVATTEGGGATLLKLIANASKEVTFKNMFPMAVMPFAYSGVSSAISAGIDAAHHQGSFGCRFMNDVLNKSGDNVIMANFAWATPLATFAGGAAEALSGGKVAANTVKAAAETAQTLYFNGMMVAGGWNGGKECIRSYRDANNSSDDADIRNAQANSTLKTCADVVTNGAFLAHGTYEMGSKAVDSIKDSNVGKAISNTRDANASAAANEHTVGMTINDGKDSYQVLQVGKNAQGSFVVAEHPDGTVFQIYDSQLKNAKTTVSLGADKTKLAQAQARYDQLGKPVQLELFADKTDGPKPAGVAEAKAPSDVATAEDTGPKPKEFYDDTIATMKAHDPAVKKLAEKVSGRLGKMFDKVSKDLDLRVKGEFTMEQVVDSLNRDELVKLDKKIELDPEGVQKELSKAEEICMRPVAKNDDGSWDPEGNFIGILYAQNSLGCSID